MVVLANFYSVPTDEGKRENTGYIATQQSYKAKIKDHVLSHQFKRKSVENQYWVHFGNSLAIATKAEHLRAPWPSISIARYYNQGKCTLTCFKGMYNNIHSSTIPKSKKKKKNWKPPKYPSSIEWLSRLWSVHSVEYSMAMRIKFFLHATTWVNLTNIMLGKRNQRKKEWKLFDAMHVKLLGCCFFKG